MTQSALNTFPLAGAVTQNKRATLLALSIGFFMVIIDLTIVNITLPQMAKSLGGDISWLQWVVDGYTLTFACLLLSAGNLGDQFGAKTAFLWGLALFALTSIGCGLANSFWLVTVFRLLQGMAAALIVPTSLALINSTYEDKKERAKAIGIWASIGGIAAAAGPILGGILTTCFNWRAVFFVNVPVALLGFLLTLQYVPRPLGKEKSTFDLAGQITGIIMIAALAFSLIEAGKLGWFSPLVVSGFVIFAVTLVAFLIIEHRASSPLFPLKLFRSASFSVAIAIAMIMNLGAYGESFVLTLYFQEIRNYPILIAGFAFLPLLGLTAIASYFGGKMTSIKGPRWPIVIGLTVAMIGFFTLIIANQNTPYALLILPLAAIGFGCAFTVPAATVAVIHSAHDGKAGLASGAFNASRQIGALLGVAIFGTLLATANNFITGMHITLLIAGFAFLMGILLTAVYIKN